MRLAPLLPALLLAILPLASQAETPEEYAARLEQWRQVCSDPNPDLAAGHLQSALATGDPAARKICLRATLNSDNDDLRSTALRQVIGTLPLIRFHVTVPETDAYRYVAPYVQNGLIFHANNGDPSAGSATWQPLMENVTPHEGGTGTVNVFGSDLIWTGKAYASNRWNSCSLRASLNEGSQVTGQLICAGTTPFPVVANLLD